MLPPSEEGIRVLSQVESEKLYSDKVTPPLSLSSSLLLISLSPQHEEALKQENSRAAIHERAEQSLLVEDPTETIRRVVTDGITSQEVQHTPLSLRPSPPSLPLSLMSCPCSDDVQASNALRVANKMSKRKQGRRAGYGWTVEELLRDSALASEGQYALAKKASLKNKLTSQTPSRYELKQLSLAARNRSSASHFGDAHAHPNGNASAASGAAAMSLSLSHNPSSATSATGSVEEMAPSAASASSLANTIS
jgi:hypothetical protein